MFILPLSALTKEGDQNESHVGGRRRRTSLMEKKRRDEDEEKICRNATGRSIFQIRIDRICAADVLRSFLFLVSRFDNGVVLWPFLAFSPFSLSPLSRRPIFVVSEGEKKASLITVHNTPDDNVRSVCVPFSGNVVMCVVSPSSPCFTRSSF